MFNRKTMCALAMLTLGLAMPATMAADSTTPLPASQPMGRGMGGHMGGMYGQHQWRMMRSNTMGYGLMTPAERTEHRNHMLGIKTLDECRAYVAQHQALMQQRAATQGKTLPMPHNDPCTQMQGMGMFNQ